MPASFSTPDSVSRARAFVRPTLCAMAFVAASLAAGAAAGADRMQFVGSAVQKHHAVQLTQWQGDEAGAVWDHRPLQLDRSFQVNFSFSLVGNDRTAPQADGIAFVLQTDGRHAVGGGGGGIGYLGLHGVASVVQTWVNNHVGFNLNGDPYDAPAAPADLGGARSVKGKETVTYDAATHMLTMTGKLYVDGVPYDIADAREADLVALLGSSEAIMGLTGGTGAVVADQRIESFRFRYMP